jgi:hypothetical protein
VNAGRDYDLGAREIIEELRRVRHTILEFRRYSVTTRQIRAVLVDVGMPPRIVETAPAALWTAVGGVPERFATFAFTRYGRRFAEVWCRDVAGPDRNRFVVTPTCLCLEFRGEISGPILITAGHGKTGETLSMTKEEGEMSISFAARWPNITQTEFGRPREHLRIGCTRKVRPLPIRGANS